MNAEELNQKMKGKQPYTLNISENMTERIVQNARHLIGKLEGDRADLLPLFEEKRLAYEQAQREFNDTKGTIDSIDEEIRQQNLVLEVLVNFKDNPSPDKRMRLHGEPGETETKTRRSRTESGERISWQAEALAALKELRQFIPADDLIDMVLQKPHIQEQVKNMKSGKFPSTLKATTVTNLISHALKVSRGEWKGPAAPKFTVYKDLLGLLEWVDKDNNPVEPYKNQFVHKKLQRGAAAAPASE
jgi:hypothetical protein